MKSEKVSLFINYSDLTKQIIEESTKEILEISESLTKQDEVVVMTSTYYDYELDYIILTKVREAFDLITYTKESISELIKYIRSAVDTNVEGKIIH